MNRIISREVRRQLARENARLPSALQALPRAAWPESSDPDNKPFAVWRSRNYLVQGFHEAGGITRLSVNKTAMRPDGQWEDGLTWDDLQDIKRQIGLGDYQAIEIYPKDRDIVNDANMRHLWILRAPLNIGWTKS